MGTRGGIPATGGDPRRGFHSSHAWLTGKGRILAPASRSGAANNLAKATSSTCDASPRGCPLHRCSWPRLTTTSKSASATATRPDRTEALAEAVARRHQRLTSASATPPNPRHPNPGHLSRLGGLAAHEHAHEDVVIHPAA